MTAARSPSLEEIAILTLNQYPLLPGCDALGHGKHECMKCLCKAIEAALRSQREAALEEAASLYDSHRVGRAHGRAAVCTGDCIRALLASESGEGK